MEYWEDFERILTAILKLAFYRNWEYTVEPITRSSQKPIEGE